MTRPDVGVMRDLLAKVVAAKGANRELSCSLAHALGWTPKPGASGWDTGSPWAWCPEFTGSIDAAVGFVERVLPTKLLRLSNEHQGMWKATVGLSTAPAMRTAPLAICAALLTALIAAEDRHG